MLCRKGVKSITRSLDRYPYNAIRNAGIQIVHVHPIVIIFLGTSTNSVSIVCNNLLASHGSTGSGPGQQVIVITTNSGLAALGSTAGGKKVVYLALVKIGIPRNNSLV